MKLLTPAERVGPPVFEMTLAELVDMRNELRSSEDSIYHQVATQSGTADDTIYVTVQLKGGTTFEGIVPRATR